jgi:hypothetical protein
MTDAPLTGHCHCGQVTITIPAQPDYVNDCNCTLCSKIGALWGYFDPADVRVAGETQQYSRADSADPAVIAHFCGRCGCTTHWTATKAFVRRVGENNRMGANMRLFPPAALRGVEIRFPDGRGWNGVGQFGYRRESEVG